MRVETKTIALQIDERFTGQLVDYEGGSVWVGAGPGKPPLPIFNFALSEKVDLYDMFEGDLPEGDEALRYKAALLAYFDMKASGAASHEDSIQEIGGRLAYVRTTYMAMPQYGDEEVFRLFVNIPLDEEFCQEFSAVCRPDQREEFEPLFWETIRTAEYRGDRAEAIRIQEEAREELYARVDALAAKAEALTADLPRGVAPGTAPEPPSFEPFVIPEDGSSLFRMGEFELAFVEDETTVGTTSFTHEFGFEFVGRAADPSAAAKAQLTSEYNDDGEIKFPIYFTGAYRKGGVPEASLDFESGKCKSPYINPSIDGLEYGLEFTGRVEVVAGWISIRGRVACSYDESQPSFDVEIRRAFDPSTIDWTQYRFGSLDELDAARVEEVHYFFLNADDLDRFPEKLLRCRSLKQLGISRVGSGERGALEVPEDLGSLKNLESLSIRGFKLESLPESVGELQRLETLQLPGAGLDALPSGVWKLAHLNYLFLDGNALMELPAEVDLPELYSIDLENNRLATIPETFARQPKLRRIKLDGNPLESLPDVYNDADVELELSSVDKRRLLDFEYRGAGGRGLVPWDEDQFYVRSDSALAAATRGRLDASEWTDFADGIQFLLKRGVGLNESGKDDYTAIGNHRFGGMPDLPSSIPYPHFTQSDDEKNLAYEFIGQINCADIAPHQGYLPRSGMLYFFLTTLHDLYGGSSTSAAKVIHFDSSTEKLVSGKDLQIPADKYYEMVDDAHEALCVTAAPMVSMPEFYGARQNEHLFRGPATALKEAQDELEGLDEDPGLREVCGGEIPDFAINAYVFTQHEDPEHQVSLRQKGNPEDWVVLLMVGSSGSFMWGDAGTLSYVIHKSDLAQGDFSNVHCTLESS